VGILAGGSTAISLILLHLFPIWWVLLIIVVILSSFLFVLFWYVKKVIDWHWNIFFASLFTVFSGIALLMVVDTLSIRKWFIVFIASSVGLLHSWGVAERLEEFYSGSTFRRYMMMLLVFDAYALMTFLFALSSFFVSTFFFLFVVICGGILLGGLAVHIWRLYFNVDRQSLLIWGWIIGLVSLELIWIIHMLPFTYAVLGLLVTWIWYVMQLFVRFHLGERGIIWKKQAIFLIGNALVYIALLFFFVRWV
jgi:hypothetical protein